MSNIYTAEDVYTDLINAFRYTDCAYELDKLRETAHSLFGKIGSNVETDTYKCVHNYLRKMEADVDLASRCKLSIDDLSMKTQNFYQAFSKRMESNKVYAGKHSANRFEKTDIHLIHFTDYNILNHIFQI